MNGKVKINAVLGIAILVLAAWVLPSGTVRAGEKKALLIMLDGLRADAAFSADTPYLDALKTGLWSGFSDDKGYCGFWTYEAHTNHDAAPSSATNHVAIATGVTAEKNRVFQNGHIQDGDYAAYPTWLQRIRKADGSLKTVWLYNWDEDGNMPGDATFENTHGHGFDGDMRLLDDAKSLLAGTFPTTDGVKGTRWTAGDDVDAMMLYLDSLDMFGHKFGFSVRVNEYFEKVTEYDAKIGELLETIRNRPHFAQEDWMIIVVSDHGGIGRTHGVNGCLNCYTIPIFVSAQGLLPEGLRSAEMAGQPQNCVCSAFLMKHFTGAVPECFDGKIPEPRKEETVEIFADSKPAAEFPAGEPQGSFSTVIFFEPAGIQKGDPALVSNKDWKSGLNPGFCVAANSGEDGCHARANLGDGEKRVDFGALDYDPNGIVFLALTADRDGNGVFYVGGMDGRLAFVSTDVSFLKSFASEFPWNVGQDGTGSYPHTLNGKCHAWGWPRALSNKEVAAIYKRLTDQTVRFELDLSQAPESVQKWARETMLPTLTEWYPKLEKMLPSEGFRAPRVCRIRFVPGEPNQVAYTRGNEITCFFPWFEQNLNGEALGAVVHELTHVVQQYRHVPANPNPGWLVEGLTDYIRWFLFEPAELRPRVDFRRAKVTDGYRTTAAFLDFVLRKYDADLVRRLNDTMRRCEYTEEYWTQTTGHTLAELWEEFRQESAK